MKKAEADHPVAGEGQVYCVVRKGELLKIRKFWSDAHGWQKKLAGSTVEVRKESDVKKPERIGAKARKARGRAPFGPRSSPMDGKAD